MASDDEKLNSFLTIDTVDDDFFNAIVERKLGKARDEFKLRLVYIAPATGKNENYASVVYRARIGIEIIGTGERLFVSAIIKALLTTIKEIKEFGVFPRERFMYEDVIGSFERIMEERAGERIEFGPQCLAVHSEPYEIIILEDLKASGYQVIDRKVGTNYQQTMLVMEKLAKFHAASVIRYQQDGEIQDFLDRNISMPKFPRDSPISASFARMFSAFLEGVRTLDISPTIVEKISRWNFLDMMESAWIGCAPMKCGFRVLNHGDTWATNMMFKMEAESDETSAMKFIDYQMSYWGTPLGDLAYFLISSVADDVKVKHFDEFIERYQQELESALRKMNYDSYIPTLQDFRDEMEEKKSLFAAQTVGIMFICKYDSSKEINLGDLFSGMMDDDTMRSMYCNDNFLKALQIWLPFLDERGYLDVFLPSE